MTSVTTDGRRPYRPKRESGARSPPRCSPAVARSSCSPRVLIWLWRCPARTGTPTVDASDHAPPTTTAHGAAATHAPTTPRPPTARRPTTTTPTGHAPGGVTEPRRLRGRARASTLDPFQRTRARRARRRPLGARRRADRLGQDARRRVRDRAGARRRREGLLHDAAQGALEPEVRGPGPRATGASGSVS